MTRIQLGFNFNFTIRNAEKREGTYRKMNGICI